MIDLHDERSTDAAVVGGKAAALARLARAGFDVPRFVVLLHGDGPRDLPAATRYAVRSSAAGEDAAGHSFAGQFESFLNIAPADVAARASDVRRSADAARVAAYRKRHSLPRVEPAVIVQAMADAASAGVAFGADPAGGRRDFCVISAVCGLGDKLVGGEAGGETWHVDRHGRVVLRPDDPAVLDDAAATRVAELAWRCNAHFGRPQDVEWAVDQSGKLWLLQSRPITALPPDPTAAADLWDNANIVESYGGVVSPLTFSFARTAYAGVYRAYCELMGVPRRTLEANADVFGRMLGRHRGRVYYNLPSWYRVLAMLPGYRFNRRFMEQMMGAKEPLPAGIERRVAPPPATRGQRAADAGRLLRTTLALAARQATLRRRVRAFRRRVDGALATPTPLERMRADELAAHYRGLESRLLARWDAPLVNDFLAMIYSGVLRSLCTKWLGDPALHPPLVAPCGDVASAEPARRLRAIARLVADDSILLDAMTDWSVTEVEMLLKHRRPDLRPDVDRYLADFGDRCVEELKLESPTLADDPTPMYRAIAALAGRPEPAGNAAVDAAERVVNAKLPRGSPRRVAFNLIRNAARRRLADRELLRLDRTRVFGRARRVFVELGRRLAEAGLLDDPADVFFLELHELLGAVEGTTTTADLRGLIAVRRREHGRDLAADPPPERFVTRGPALAASYEPTATAKPAPAATAHELRGVGSGAGSRRGVVVVVRDPRADVPAGRVLVTERTDPGWVLLMASAAALVIERGSVLSHAAVVARELGVPAVVACANATRLLRDGDEVEVDGAAGVVRVLQRADA